MIGENILDRARPARITVLALPPAGSAFRPFPKPAHALVTSVPVIGDPYRSEPAETVTIVLEHDRASPRAVVVAAACGVVAVAGTVYAISSGSYASILFYALVVALGASPWIDRSHKRRTISLDAERLRVRAAVRPVSVRLVDIEALESVEHREAVDHYLMGIPVGRSVDRRRRYEVRVRAANELLQIAQLGTLEECWWLEDELRSRARQRLPKPAA